MKKFLSFLLLTFASLTFALGRLEIDSVKTLNETHTQILKYDADGKYAPLLFVKTDLKPLLFQNVGRGNRNAPEWDEANHQWKCYLNVGQNRIKIGSTGYDPIQINLRDYGITSEEKRCYELTLIDYPELEVIPFSIISFPADAEKWIDGENLGTDQGFQLAEGSHELELRKAGYKTKKLTINVNKSTPFVNVDKMHAHELMKVTIGSTPEKAKIYIDNASKGETNHSLFLFPGRYNLKLLKSGYQIADKEIEIVEGAKNNLSYTLTRSASNPTIDTESEIAAILTENASYLDFDVEPKDVTISINKEDATGQKRVKLAPGCYLIELSKTGCRSKQQIVALESGQTKTIQEKLSQVTGTLQFSVVPDNAQVILSREGKTIDQWSGTKVLQNLTPGEYRLKAKANGHINKTASVKIEENKVTDIEMILQKGSDLKSYTSKSGIAMVAIDGGDFQMGSNEGSEDRQPVHRVTVSSFYIGKYEVTQKQWRDVMGKNPSHFEYDSYPVESISWYDCVEFCNKLSRKEGLTPCYTIDKNTKDPNNHWRFDDVKWTVTCNHTANGYRLPTEAEWEYAARGGNKSRGYVFSGSNDNEDVGGYTTHNHVETPFEVGSLKPNELGIYDMSGNVSEFCWDWYGEDYYSKSLTMNPIGPQSGSYRVSRGGCWCCPYAEYEVAQRSSNNANDGSYNVGFRVCRTAE